MEIKLELYNFHHSKLEMLGMCAIWPFVCTFNEALETHPYFTVEMKIGGANKVEKEASTRREPTFGLESIIYRQNDIKRTMKGERENISNNSCSIVLLSFRSISTA